MSQSLLFANPGLFVRQCDRCLNTGLWIEPSGNVSPCPQIQIGADHAVPNLAEALKRATDLLRFHGSAANPLAFEIARTLTFYSSAGPCSRVTILEKHFTWTNSKLRNLAAVIEELRSVWLLPVGSRKADPSGYWIITDAADFKDWFERTKSAPITQLSWIHRVAKANFPVFAEQMELNFWNDIEAPASPSSAAGVSPDAPAAGTSTASRPAF